MNRGPATRKAHRRCETCGSFYRPVKPTRRYCSKPCAAKGRTRASRIAAGRKGGLSSGIRRRGASRDRIAAMVASLTPLQAFWKGRQYGTGDESNRRQMAYREGYAAGYEAACEACAALGWRTA